MSDLDRLHDDDDRDAPVPRSKTGSLDLVPGVSSAHLAARVIANASGRTEEALDMLNRGVIDESEVLEWASGFCSKETASFIAANFVEIAMILERESALLSAPVHALVFPAGAEADAVQVRERLEGV